MRIVERLKEIKNFNRKGRPSDADKPEWNAPYDTLRGKWIEVPIGPGTYNRTSRLIELSDRELLAEWERARCAITTGPEFTHRGWYHSLYADGMRSKRILDVGSGFGVDSITFAQHGARLTFVDLVETSLKVLERLCKILGLQGVQFILMKDLDSLKPVDTDYDVIMAMGSLHHAPMHILKPEYQELVRHLKVGGRWLQLAYPRSRWIHDGREPFSTWGTLTDGPGTPWAEWLEPEKLLDMLAPARFEIVLYREFHRGLLNWFDLLYKGK